jgi:hypothetical protein
MNRMIALAAAVPFVPVVPATAALRNGTNTAGRITRRAVPT